MTVPKVLQQRMRRKFLFHIRPCNCATKICILSSFCLSSLTALRFTSEDSALDNSVTSVPHLACESKTASSSKAIVERWSSLITFDNGDCPILPALFPRLSLSDEKILSNPSIPTSLKLTAHSKGPAACYFLT